MAACVSSLKSFLETVLLCIPFDTKYFYPLQKYEMIKTEDIPHLENSTFSTRVVKDIAQNILSFLKSNCTKEGHTYWLFKGVTHLNTLFVDRSASRLCAVVTCVLSICSERERHCEAL